MPPKTLAAWFGCLEPRLPTTFAPALAACRNRAAAFRGEVMAVLELPLGAAAPAVCDFSVRLEEAEQCLAPEMLPPAVAELFRARAAGELPAPWVPAAWLEYDLRRAGARAPIVCFRIGPEAPGDWIGRELLPRIGAGLSRGALQRAAAALDSLPAGARPLYLFDLAARGAPGLRCELAAEPETLTGWLEEIGAATQAATLAGLAERWPEAGDRPHVSLDFGGAWLPRVGLENSFRGQPPGEERWRRQLEAFAAAGLATGGQVETLLSWPGVLTPSSGPPGWPSEGGRPLPGWLVACLSHLKLAQAPGGELEVKAYLLFQYLAREVRTWPSR